jgi:phosphorylcholine metabolism protein LicD
MIIFIIIIIIFLITLFKLFYNKGIYNEKISNIETIIEYIKNTENSRNIAMNGIDIKYYINYVFHYQVYKLFELVIRKLDKLNIKYFLIGGGLIGYFRHNQGLIPWDDDIDIAVIEDDREKLYNAINEIMKENNNISFIINNDNLDLDKVVYGKMNDNPIQLDIFYFKYFPDNQYYDFTSERTRNLWPNQYIYKDEIFPLESVSYYLYDIYGIKNDGIKIKIPNKSKKYLDRIYKNWETIKTPTHSHSKYYKLLFS